MERVAGIEPASQPWKGRIIATIRYPRILVGSRMSEVETTDRPIQREKRISKPRGARKAKIKNPSEGRRVGGGLKVRGIGRRAVGRRGFRRTRWSGFVRDGHHGLRARGGRIRIIRPVGRFFAGTYGWPDVHRCAPQQPAYANEPKNGNAASDQMSHFSLRVGQKEVIRPWAEGQGRRLL